MAKTGRNDLCPCGSGKKYKKCCLTNDEAAEREQLAAAVQPAGLRLPGLAEEFTVTPAAAYCGDDETDELTDASNAVVDLVHTGKLDEAEEAARDLLVRFPDEHDGYDRLGMVYEARGENRQAADCYRKVVAMIRDHPDNYDPDFDAVYQKLVDKLDPPAGQVP
jgi:tetratricopeptide (TPR) repeat protein